MDRAGAVHAETRRAPEALDTKLPWLVVEADGRLSAGTASEINDRDREVSQHEGTVRLADARGDVRPVDEYVEDLAGVTALAARGGLTLRTDRRRRRRTLGARGVRGDDNLEAHSAG